VALSLLALAGCAGSPGTEPPPAGDAVASIGEVSLTRAQLEAYLALNFPGGDLEGDEVAGGDAEPAPDPNRDTVLSRLFDNFVEERLLLVEAQRDGIEVTEEEVDRYLGSVPEGGDPEAAEADADLRDIVRDALIVQKFRESVTRSQVIVTDREVETHLARTRGDVTAEGMMVVRTLMLESMKQADRVRRDIRRGRTTFAEAAVKYGPPGHGMPLELAPGDLPEEFQQALQKMKPGWVSSPIEVQGEAYLIKLDSRTGLREEELDELRRQAREELTGARSRQILEELIDELSRESGLEIHAANLPFRYVPESDEI
jgi:hypothetical protein